MQQTFKKTILSHYLQFNRLLYPCRYIVKIDDEGSSGMQIEVKKDEDGKWHLPHTKDLPGWFSEGNSNIIKTIEENERRTDLSI